MAYELKCDCGFSAGIVQERHLIGGMLRVGIGYTDQWFVFEPKSPGDQEAEKRMREHYRNPRLRGRHSFRLESQHS